MRNTINFNSVINSTYDVYRKKLLTFVGYSIVATMVATVLMYVVMIPVGIILTVIGVAVGVAMGNEIIIIIIFILAVIIMIPIAGILYMPVAGVAKAVEHYREGKDFNFGDLFTFGFKRIPYLITATIAFSLVNLVIFSIGGVIGFLIYVAIGVFNVSSIILMSIIGLLTIIGSLIFSVRSVFYLQVAVCEKRHFFAAILRSFKLVKGYFMKILGAIISLILAYYVVYFSTGNIITFAVYIAASISQLFDSQITTVILMALQVLANIFQAVLSGAIIPIMYLGFAFLYFNQRNKKEGLDMHLKIDQLHKEWQESRQSILVGER